MNSKETFIDADDVIQFTGVKSQSLKLGKDEKGDLYKLVESWIIQAESLIKSYCRHDFSSYDEIPPAVKNVCLRLTANMVTQAIARRDTPITKVNDWNISTVGSRIFTNDLKEDLEPFRIDKSNRSDRVDIIAITGADIHGKSHHKHR